MKKIFLLIFILLFFSGDYIFARYGATPETCFGDHQ
jgi:hypothetical protein